MQTVMKTITFKDAYRMYWTVFAKMLGEENVQFTFYRSQVRFLGDKFGIPFAEVDIWCGEKRDFTAHEVFPLLVQYFAQISCDASAHGNGIIQLDIDDQFMEIQEPGEFSDGLDETAPYEVG